MVYLIALHHLLITRMSVEVSNALHSEELFGDCHCRDSRDSTPISLIVFNRDHFHTYCDLFCINIVSLLMTKNSNCLLLVNAKYACSTIVRITKCSCLGCQHEWLQVEEL